MNWGIFRVWLFLSALSLLSCVSVKIQPADKVDIAENVDYQNPPYDFLIKENNSYDRLWIHRINGNSISYKSSCNDPLDPSLLVLRSTTLQGIDVHQIVHSSKTTYNSREALQEHVRASIDGIPIEIELMIFKRNKCSYILSYWGKSKNFSQNRNNFKEFLESFRVP